MPEGLPDKLEGGAEAGTDALSSVIKDLGISPEVEQMIRKLEGTKRERCIIDLEDIAAEVKEKNIGNADRDKRIKETLATDYGILIPGGDRTGIMNNDEGLPVTITSKISAEGVNELNNDINARQLRERLEAVKSLDAPLIETELKKAKAAQPLPEDIRANITKATGIPPEGLDAAIASGVNPLVNNLVDTYYLTYAEDEIIGKLPPGIKVDVEKRFSDLRASAREYGVLAEFQSRDLERNIADKPDRSQQLILSGAAAITGGRGDIPVVRQGEQLLFKSPNGKEVTHSMDISKIPPVVTKFRGAIELSYEVPDKKSLELQAKYRTDLDDNKRDSNKIAAKITDAHTKTEKRLRTVKQDIISIDELSAAIEGIASGNSLEMRKEQSEKIIRLCETGERAEVFEAKTDIQGDMLTSSEGFRDYFYGQKVEAIELRKKFEEEGILQGKIKPNQNPLTSPAQIEGIAAQNLDGLQDMGISQFASMAEVSAFLMSINGPEIGGRWIGIEEINNSLTSEGIPPSMWEKLVTSLAKVQDSLSGTTLASMGFSEKLRALKKSEGNGKISITNALQNYRITKKGGGSLTKQDFDSLLSQGANPN